jgi:hypothetical protein
MIQIRLSISLLLAGILPSARAQSVDSVPLARVPPGSAVRVWIQNPPLNKWKLVYTGSTANAISFAEPDRSAQVTEFRSTIPLEDVRRLEAYRGRRQRGSYFLTHTLVGAAIGAFMGGTIGAVLDEGLQNPAGDRRLGVMGFGAIGLATGTPGGAIVGANGQAVWAPVILPP